VGGPATALGVPGTVTAGTDAGLAAPGRGRGTVPPVTGFSRTVDAGLGRFGAVGAVDAAGLAPAGGFGCAAGLGVASAGCSPTPVVSTRKPCVDAYRRIASFTR
jgi:hypothetical protein